MVEGTRPGLTLLEATQAGDRCNKASPWSTIPLHVIELGVFWLLLA
jgi:hypothetical protein